MRVHGLVLERLWKEQVFRSLLGKPRPFLPQGERKRMHVPCVALVLFRSRQNIVLYVAPPTSESRCCLLRNM
jgi:hypothetical protein